MTPELILTTHRDVFYQAIMKQDWKALAHLYADNYMLVRSDGSALTRGEVLDDLRAHNLVFESIEIVDEKVRVIDSVAVLTGKSRTVSRNAGIQVTSWFRLVAIYVEATNGVKLLHFQSTPLPSDSVVSRPAS